MLSLSGTILATFSPDIDPGFGIRNVAWHPSGMFLVVGGWDDKVCNQCMRALFLPKYTSSQVHVLDCLSWSPVVTFELSTKPAGTVRKRPILAASSLNLPDILAGTTEVVGNNRRSGIFVL